MISRAMYSLGARRSCIRELLEYASIYPVKDFYRLPLSGKAILDLLILSFSIVILLLLHKFTYVN